MTMVRHSLMVLLSAMMLMLVPEVRAVEPDEILSDPVLEARAREVSKEVRCLVCRNESIDDSNADLARDLRILVRERIVAGDTNEEVKDYLVDRYGEYVLLRPRFSISNAFLWLAGPVLFLLGLIAAVVYIRRRRPGLADGATTKLSDAERAELDRILKED